MYVLEQTAIAPNDTDSLFELFVLFRFIATIEDIRESTPQFQTIATDQQEVVRFDGDQEIVLYHDNSTRDRNLSFTAVSDEADTQSRTDRVQHVAKEVASNYFKKDYQDHTGRPDVIVFEIISDDGDHEYLIVEVKNSANEDTIRRGIKETLEYLAFLRLNEQYIFGRDDEEYFGSGWNGLLVVQDLKRETASLEEQAESELKVLQASELENQLAQVLKQKL